MSKNLDKILLKASVSDIVYTLIPAPRPKFFYLWYGNSLQYKLGYMNYEKFSRVYQRDNVVLKVSGVPDKIDYRNGIVHELKVTRNGLKPEQISRAKMQVLLYLWLTGMKYGCLDIYHIREGELEVCYERIEYNELEVKKILDSYIDIRLEEERRRERFVSN